MGDFDLGFTSLYFIFISLLRLSVRHLDTPDQSSYLSYPLLDFIYQRGGVLFSGDSSISRLHRPHSKRHETHQIPHPRSHTHPQMSWALSALSSARDLPVHPRTFHSLPQPCSSALKIPLEKTLEYNSCSALYSCDHLPWLASLTALG